MAEVELRVPQIGEGLQEARIVGFLKAAGDPVKRDEPIYQMETDKAVMDVESPYDGRIVAWEAQADQVLKIGAVVGRIETAAAGQAEPEAAVLQAQPAEAGTVALKVPQLGEGLQEARIVALLKQPGDQVKRDEPIYQMETDKAVMDVESPHDGVLERWAVKADEMVKIGADVAYLSGVAGAPAAAPAPAPQAAAATAAPQRPSPAAGRRLDVPPRTRAYALAKGLTAAQIETVPAQGAKLMPEDVDRFLAGGAAAPEAGGPAYRDAPMSPKQRVLASRLQRGNQLTVPGMMSVSCDWGTIERKRAAAKSAGGEFQPSAFTMFAYCVARAAADHPVVRSTLAGEGVVRTYDHLQLGIAVALPGDELVVAVVEDASRLGWREFAEQAKAKIELARGGKDQANESVTLSITNMQAYGIRDAMAVVVPPGVATVFLGEPHWAFGSDPGDPAPRRSANVGITIDHRLINGVGGAEFLLSVRKYVESGELFA